MKDKARQETQKTERIDGKRLSNLIFDVVALTKQNQRSKPKKQKDKTRKQNKEKKQGRKKENNKREREKKKRSKKKRE